VELRKRVKPLDGAGRTHRRGNVAQSGGVQLQLAASRAQQRVRGSRVVGAHGTLARAPAQAIEPGSVGADAGAPHALIVTEAELHVFRKETQDGKERAQRATAADLVEQLVAVVLLIVEAVSASSCTAIRAFWRRRVDLDVAVDHDVEREV
jgi:hypothetical protein